MSINQHKIAEKVVIDMAESQNNTEQSNDYKVSGIKDLEEYAKQLKYAYNLDGSSLYLVDAAQKASLKAHFEFNDHHLGNIFTGMAKKMAIEAATKGLMNEKTGQPMTIWELDELLSKNNSSTQELEAFWYTLQIEAEHLFDSFLLFVERKREYRNKFYAGRRSILWKHGIIQSMQDLEDDKLDLLALSLPPGTGKTTIEKYFAAWVIGRHIGDYSLFYSHSDDITRMFYDGVVDITTNDVEYQYRDCWLAKPVILYGLNAKRQTINFNTYKPFASLQNTSVGASNAGKCRCNRYLYCDDLIGGIEQALNKNQLDKLWEKYSVDARQRMLEGCKEIHIATRWSVHDVIGRLQNIHEGDERARFINIPALDDKGHSNFKYRIGGFKTKFFRQQQEIMDELSFNALYMGQPIEREGLLYHKDELRYYETLPEREPDAVLGVCDTKSKGTDFMFAPCLYQYDNDYYLVDCVCDDTTNYTLQYNKLTDLIVNNGMKQIEFESNAGGDRVAFEVDKMVKARGWACNVTSKPTTTNKETRIITYSDWVKNNVVFKSPEQYAKKSDYGVMMMWLFAYTQTGKNPHDDVPDGLANFAKFVERKYNVKGTKIMSSPI